MSELSKKSVIAKSCQLSSLLGVISCGDINHVERENLLDLANDLAGEIATFMLEHDSEEAESE